MAHFARLASGVRRSLLVGSFLGVATVLAACSSSGDKSITLEFKEGGNIKAGDSHMHKAVITFLGADRLKSAWYPMVGGKLGDPATFDLKRQK